MMRMPILTPVRVHGSVVVEPARQPGYERAYGALTRSRLRIGLSVHFIEEKSWPEMGGTAAVHAVIRTMTNAER
jgi:hypothetical protein